MKQRINEWYKKLSPLAQLGIAFLVSWIYFFILAYLFDRFRLFYQEQRSILYQVLHATWMAFWLTVVFNWSKIKMAVKRK